MGPRPFSSPMRHSVLWMTALGVASGLSREGSLRPDAPLVPLEAQLRERAAARLSCAPSDLVVEPFDDATLARVTGNGQSLTFRRYQLVLPSTKRVLVLPTWLPDGSKPGTG